MPRQRNARGPERTPDAPFAGELSVRDHILDRTILLIGRRGTTDVTVREIAREAGVNVAAVNYYFSSKEQMFAQMGERFHQGYGEVMGILETPGVPPEERLRRWSMEVMRHLSDYPGILGIMERYMTSEPEDPFGKVLRTSMRQAVSRLRATIREIVVTPDPRRIAFKLTLLASALAGPLPGLLGQPQDRRGLRTPAARERFLDLLLEHLRK
jgi:AcrR family transcriptional regulator